MSLKCFFSNYDTINGYRISRNVACVVIRGRPWGVSREATQQRFLVNFFLSQITCETNYYKDCTVYCAETLTSTCNDSDGTKVCKLGWSGPDCDIGRCTSNFILSRFDIYLYSIKKNQHGAQFKFKMLSWDADALVPGAVSAVKIGVNLDLIMWPIRRANFL